MDVERQIHNALEARLKKMVPTELKNIHVPMERTHDDETLQWLEKAAEEHTPWLPELKVEPTWDAVRSHPRFIAILKKMGLEK